MGEEIFLIYKGKRGSSYEYIKLPSLEMNNGDKRAEELDLTLSRYGKKIFKAGSVGSIYKVMDEGEAISYNPKQIPVNFWKHLGDRAAWRALSNAEELKDKQLKDGAKNMLHEALEPAREAYREATYEGRTLILAEVIRFITNR